MKPLRTLLFMLVLCSSLFAQAQDGEAKQDTVFDLAAIPVQPEFPGGKEAMYTWLRDNTHYPKEALKKKIEGKVYVEFVVEKDGHIDKVVLRRGCNPLLDAEALRVIGQMPAWKPGRLEDGTAAASRFTIPMQFKL